MNLLYFTTIDPSGNSGQNISTKEIIKSLGCDEDINLLVICPKFINSVTLEYLNKAEMIFLPRKRSKSIFWVIIVNIWIILKLKSLLKNKSIDLLVARPGMTYLPLKIAKKLRIKSFLLVRGMILRKNFSFLKYKIIKFIELQNLKYADKVYVAYKDILDEYNLYFPFKQITVFTNAVNPKLFMLLDKNTVRREIGLFESNDFVVGFVGSLKKKHNVDVLIKSIKELPERLKLLIVGEGEGLIALKQIAEQLSISHRIIFTGRVPHNIVNRYISLCDVMYGVVDKSNPSNPIKCYEYLASGKPIITSKKDEFLFVEENLFGFLINSSDNVLELKSVLLKLISENYHFNEKHMRQYIIQNHTWDILVKLMKLDYSNTIKEETII